MSNAEYPRLGSSGAERRRLGALNRTDGAIATAYRYIREAVDLVAAVAPTLEQAMTTVRKKAYVILDGTVLPIDRIAADRPYYSGKKKHHGMNVQVLADPAGRLIWVLDALPGAVHDLTAARTHGIPDALAVDDIKCWAGKAYQGAGPAVRVPFRGENLRGWRRRHNPSGSGTPAQLHTILAAGR